MENQQKNNPLHGLTLEKILNDLVDYYNWDMLARLIPINCFINEPSMKSSLKFLRRTPWARKKVEALYLENIERFRQQ
ncbi:MAG: VF530 family DNA-binding protein [Salinivirgaceae bacterium]